MTLNMNGSLTDEETKLTYNIFNYIYIQEHIKKQHILVKTNKIG